MGEVVGAPSSTRARRTNRPVAGTRRRRGQPSTHHTGTVVGEHELAALLSHFARSAGLAQDPHSTPVEVVRGAIELVPGREEASVSVVLGRRQVSSEAASGEIPAVVDALQDSLAGPVPGCRLRARDRPGPGHGHRDP